MMEGCNPNKDLFLTSLREEKIVKLFEKRQRISQTMRKHQFVLEIRNIFSLSKNKGRGVVRGPFWTLPKIYPFWRAQAHRVNNQPNWVNTQWGRCIAFCILVCLSFTKRATQTETDEVLFIKIYLFGNLDWFIFYKENNSNRNRWSPLLYIFV